MSASDFTDKEDVFDLTLKQAIGVLKKKDEDFILSSKLNKVTQLTGFSDPVYAEAYVHVNQYDIVLDCSDNVITRYLINDACVLLNKPLVSGSALKFEGQVIF